MTIGELKNRRVIVGKTSITCKDDNGKTCGLVRNIKSWETLSSRESFDFFKIVRASGIWEAGFCKNLIVDGKQLYYLHDLKPIEFYEKYIREQWENDEHEKERYNLQKQLAENAPRHNIIVIPCYIIK